MVDREMVRDFAWGERLMFYSTRRSPGGGGEAELNSTSIFHRMRNIVPLHRSKPLAICVVQHLEYQRNWRRLIRISYLGWVKFYFSPSWLNIASAHDQSVTRISFTKQFLCARRSRKSTLIRSAVIVTSCHCWEWLVRNCTTVEWYAASQRLSSNRRVHNKLSRCCTIRIVEYESLWDNLGMSDIKQNMANSVWNVLMFKRDCRSFFLISLRQEKVPSILKTGYDKSWIGGELYRHPSRKRLKRDIQVSMVEIIKSPNHQLQQ